MASVLSCFPYFSVAARSINYGGLLRCEFWVGNEELVNLYEKRLGNACYINFNLERTNNRGDDGLLVAVQKDYLTVPNYKELHFNDCGDRVAQLLHVKLALSFSQSQDNDICQEILIGQHPFTSLYACIRSTRYFNMWILIRKSTNSSQCQLCYAVTGRKQTRACLQVLRPQGFKSSYDTTHHYTDADAHKYLLRRTESDEFALLKANNERCITYSGFCEALRQLNLFGHRYGLGVKETTDFLVQADIDGNGVLDYKEFQQRIWNPASSGHWEESNNEDCNDVSNGNLEQAVGLSVKNAVLFPPEVEKGVWPEDYSLSDHACLTVVFSPIRMQCSQMIP